MNDWLNSFTFCILNNLSLDHSFTFFRSHDHSFSSRTTTTFSSSLAANVGFIYLYFAK